MHEKAINVHKKGNEFQKMNQGTLLQEQKFKRDQCVKCALAAQQSFSGLKNRLILRKLAQKKGATFGSGTKNNDKSSM